MVVVPFVFVVVVLPLVVVVDEVSPPHATASIITPASIATARKSVMILFISVFLL